MTKSINTRKILISLALLTLSFYFFKNFVFSHEVIGKYIVRNGSNIVKSETDTLIIEPDLSFKNKQWGTGYTKLKYQLKGTKIKFYYKYVFGEGVISKSVHRNIFGNIIISLDRDLEIEYIKID